jgi:hypothetical protein
VVEHESMIRRAWSPARNTIVAQRSGEHVRPGADRTGYGRDGDTSIGFCLVRAASMLSAHQRITSDFTTTNSQQSPIRIKFHLPVLSFLDSI